MHTPEFWIARMDNPDEIILSTEAIQDMNRNYQRKVSSPDPFRGVSEIRMPNIDHWWPGWVMVVPDIYSMSPQAIADTVREKIKTQIKYLRGTKFGFIGGIEYADWQIDEFEHEMALDLVKDAVEVRRGIAVRNARLRNVPNFPPEQVGLWENGKTRFDMFNISILKIAKPVAVLHTSRTGLYVFVLCHEGYGWVLSEDIALSDETKINNFVNAEHFVVCTGDRVPFYSDESCTYASGWFRMGDRLPLAEENNNCKINIPMRTSYGQLIEGTVWLAPDAEVHTGFVPYTRRNIITIALKLLDNPFDWTSYWFGRNAESTYRDIFACFGFELPFHGLLFTHFGNNTKVAVPSTKDLSNVREVNAGYGTGKVGDVEEQYKVIFSNEPFVTIHCLDNGHCQLYLGEYNGVPIALDQHGYGYIGEDGTEYEIKRCCIVNMNEGVPAYALNKPMRFLELK